MILKLPTTALIMVTALLGAVSVAADFELTRAESVGMSSERLARIAPAMQRYIDTRRVPGTITAVLRRGKLVHLEVLGQMDVAADKPMRRDTVFRIASMTKPITSVALMMLWEEGGFQLRDPVAKFLPEFAEPVVSTSADASGETGKLVAVDRPIQIRDMLTHTAGLANNYIGNSEFYAAHMRRRPGDDLDCRRQDFINSGIDSVQDGDLDCVVGDPLP